MSELISKQKVLSEIAFAMVDDFPDVQALYDKIESMEPLTPPLNPKQQIVLEQLKEYKMDNLFLQMVRLRRGFLSGGVTLQVKSALEALDIRQQAQVIQVFSAWVLEQEESDG